MIAELKPDGKRPKGRQPDETPKAHPRDRAAHRFVWAFGVFMVALAGGGFLFKLVEFLTAFTSEEPFQFAILPVMTYLLVAAGFGCLFAWAYISGQFKDVEAAKYRMLEMQDEIDKQEGIV